MISMVEYLWIDGAKPTQKLRSKTRMVPMKDPKKASLSDFPEWSFDGSSTYQATGEKSDLTLTPVNFVRDPIRGVESNFLVICEVNNSDGTPHETNTRAQLRQVMDAGAASHDPWIGYEQEYTFMRNKMTPLGWPEGGYPGPQGPFYCGVGADEVHGREIVEMHAKACIEADIMIYGINAEVMPGQWEYQIGYRGLDSESADPLNVADHLWISRWLLYRLGEEYDIEATLNPKPVKGDWNGAGQHTNFSTKEMRDKKTGAAAIEQAIACLKDAHEEHIMHYGADLADRLTGEHETCNINEFRSGEGDRGASIRIPPSTVKNGYGYIEDRRPGANADPYMIAKMLLKTICLAGK